MKYPDGQEVRLADRVKLWEGCQGIVVASLDTGEFSDGYSADDWGYLKRGVLIESDKASLIHYLQPEESMELLQRNARA